MNFDALYTILAEVARDHGLLTYTELSHSYHAATGDWHEPHGSWDVPLGELNLMLHGFSWPALRCRRASGRRRRARRAGRRVLAIQSERPRPASERTHPDGHLGRDSQRRLRCGVARCAPHGPAGVANERSGSADEYQPLDDVCHLPALVDLPPL